MQALGERGAVITLTERDIDRFLSKVHFKLGCWEWLAYKDDDGYGQFSLGSRTDNSKRPYKAHRVAWTIFHGPIPPGLTIEHGCRNHGCQRHLEPLPLVENILRSPVFEGVTCGCGRTIIGPVYYRHARRCPDGGLLPAT